MDKRTFVKSVLLGVAGIYATSLAVKASRNSKRWDGVFRVSELPYPADSLEPFADAETIKLHLQHHESYTRNLNSAVVAAGLSGKTAHELMRMSSEFPKEIRHYSGGYVNHKLYWRILTPDKGSKPTKELFSAIERDFGTFDAFTEEFGRAAHSVCGSGWVWLIADKSGTLKVTSTCDHDNPMMDIAEVRGFPLMCLDVWEHAYRIRSKGKLSDHVNAFWNVVNWDVVSRRYQSASKLNFIV